MVKKKKGRLNIVLRCVLLVVVSLVIGFGVYNWNAQSLSGNAMPMPFGVGVGVVLTGSMGDDIPAGSVIVAVEQDEYEIGDDIVFQSGNMVVVHRLIGKQEIDGTQMVVTQGTANNAADEPMKAEYIKGKVIMTIPSAGNFVSFVKSPAVTFVIIAAALALLILSYRKEDKAASNDEDEKINKIKEEIKRLKEQNPESKDN